MAAQTEFKESNKVKSLEQQIFLRDSNRPEADPAVVG